MKNKKAAIELSVTAIVILILAIVILGLGLGFIRGMFGKVATQFEQQIANEPEPSRPSSSEPLTVSRETLIINSGDPVALKVGIYNPSSDTFTDTGFNLNCTTTNTMATETQFNTRDLEPGEFFTGTFLFTVGNVPDGQHLCEAQIIDSVAAVQADRDITVRITR